MTLTLKRKPLVAFVLLELFEDGNDGFIRGKSKTWLRARVEKGMFTAKYDDDDDDENELGWICRNFNSYWTRNLQTERLVIRGLKVPQRHGLASYSLFKGSGCWSLSIIFVANNTRGLGLKIKKSDLWLASGANVTRFRTQLCWKSGKTMQQCCIEQNCWSQCLIKSKLHPALDRAKNVGRTSSNVGGQTVEQRWIE